VRAPRIRTKNLISWVVSFQRMSRLNRNKLIGPESSSARSSLSTVSRVHASRLPALRLGRNIHWRSPSAVFHGEPSLISAGVIMAIVFSAKINGDAVNIYSDNNYYSGE
jgi:hypothetical protein